MNLTAQKLNLFYLLLAGSILSLVMLHSNELWTMESRWATVCYLMLRNHDYLHPYLFNGLYFDKPILSYWIIIVLAKLFGHLNEWALRLPSAIASVTCIYCTYCLGKKLFNEKIGLIAGWLLTTTYFFVVWSRIASADMLNVAGILLSLTWYFKHRNNSNFLSYCVFFLIMALTSLFKGLEGFIIPLLGVAIDLTLNRTWHKHLYRYPPNKAKRSLFNINEHCEQGSNEAASQNATTNLDPSSLVLQQGAPAVSKRSLFNINEHCEQGSNEAASQNATTNLDPSSLVLQQGAPAVSKRSLFNINEHCEQGSNEAASQNAKGINWKIIIATIISTTLYFTPFLTATLTANSHLLQTSGIYQVFHENILRYFMPFDHKNPWYTYFVYIVFYLLPWTILFFAAIYSYIKKWQTLSNQHKWLLVFFIAIFTFFSLSGSKRGYYILPLLPFAMLIMAEWIHNLFEHNPHKQEKYKRILKYCMVIFYLLIFSYFAVFQPIYNHINDNQRKLATQVNKEFDRRHDLANRTVFIINSNDNSLVFYLHIPKSSPITTVAIPQQIHAIKNFLKINELPIFIVTQQNLPLIKEILQNQAYKTITISSDRIAEQNSQNIVLFPIK